MNRDGAERLALSALAWLAGQDAALAGFLDQAGAAPGDLRRLAAQPDFLGFVMDYILGDDARVAAFCDAAGVAYDAPRRARALLPGGETPDWT